MNSYGLNELAFVDLTDPNPLPPTHVSAMRTPVATIMQGDIGTEDDFVTPRPDTLNLSLPARFSMTTRMRVLRPDIQAGRPWLHGRPRRASAFEPVLYEPESDQQMVHAVSGVSAAS